MNASRGAQFAAVVAAHLLLFATLLTFTPVREAVVQIIPVVASIMPAKSPAPLPPSPPKKVETPTPIVPMPLPTPATPLISAEPSRAEPPAMTVTNNPPPTTVAATPSAAPSPPQPASTTPKPAAQQSFTPPSFTPARSDAAYLNNPKPEYPAASLRLGETGRVVLNVHVSATGSVEQVSVRTSSGSTRLDEAALKAVRQWKFIAAKRGDEAVATQVLVPISFTPAND
ncbi:MAG: TonB family protein [Burkholderiales bacterium]